MERKLCEPPNVGGLFLQGGAVEAPQDNVMILVVHGVLDRHVPEEMEVRNQGIFCSEQHLPLQPDHAPHPHFRHQGSHCGRKCVNIS